MLSRIVARVRQTDWRILMGIALTFLWFVAGLTYLTGGPQHYTTVFEVPLEDIGNFLEGAFAPLAFLWLVIGLFIQQKELADNTEVLRESSRQSEKQTEAIAATELNARQETFFKIAENVKGQLGGISGMLFISSMGASEGSIISEKRLREFWHRLASGDDQVFSREFLLLDSQQYGGYRRLFYGTDIRTRHTLNFMNTFERLIRLAKNCDTDGIITDSLAQTAHGILYNRMCKHQPKEIERQAESVDSSSYETVLARAAQLRNPE